MILKAIRENPQALPCIMLASEVSRDMTTQEHLANLRDIVVETFQSQREKRHSRIISGLKAGYSALSQDYLATELNMFRRVTDLVYGSPDKGPEYKFPAPLQTVMVEQDPAFTGHPADRNYTN